MRQKSIRALAFYLPQFHPIPENDAWWGKGFTEWTNVVKARPRFKDHYQPHLPADLGFYDLRVPEVREAQADLARAHGIHGFCFYHYWFNGRRLLERPVDEMLWSGRPDFPYCLCWANENWTRRWDGQDNEIMLAQNYSAEDDLRHFDALLKHFLDSRYIRVHGRPLFLIYKLSRLPDPAGTLLRWQIAAQEAGLSGLYLCNVESALGEHGLAAKYALDAAVEFAPDGTNLPARVFPTTRRPPWFRHRPVGPPYTNNFVYDYNLLVEKALAKPAPDYKRFPGITPMWDNSARRLNDAVIFRGSTPELYGHWLRTVIARMNPQSGEENFLFVNAWNEWAEGNHLEPCERWGRRYLEATRAALQFGGICT